MLPLLPRTPPHQLRRESASNRGERVLPLLSRTPPRQVRWEPARPLSSPTFPHRFGAVAGSGVTYQVLARKWRPQAFEAVVGQDPVTRTLQNALKSGRVAHAYLFTGPRGVGKTTTARLLAKALACTERTGPEACNACPSCQDFVSGAPVDVMEIDAASNTGVDDIRTLRENV